MYLWAKKEKKSTHLDIIIFDDLVFFLFLLKTIASALRPRDYIELNQYKNSNFCQVKERPYFYLIFLIWPLFFYRTQRTVGKHAKKQLLAASGRAG